MLRPIAAGRAVASASGTLAFSAYQDGRYEIETLLPLPDRPAKLLPGFDSAAVSDTTIERFSRPTDFGRLLERRLAAAATVRVLLDAHCIGLVGADNGPDAA